MRIHNYKQFNESYNLDLNIKEKNEIEEKIYKKIDSMSSKELDSIFNELEKMARKLNCDVSDLSNPVTATCISYWFSPVRIMLCGG